MDCWSNELVMEFLDLYEKESIIWDPTHISHKRRNEVYDAWKRIQEQLSVQYSITDLKRKKDSLMAIFRTCYNKVKHSSMNGNEEVYKPSWFAYKKMVNFLRKNDQSWEPVINSEDESETETKFEIVPESPWITVNSNASQPQKKKRTRQEDVVNDAIDPLHQSDDEFHYIGLAIVTKMRKIDPAQRILCENLINTVLYKGMTKQLTENTRVMEPYSQYPHLE